MKYLFDTHAFIWYATGDERLSPTALSLIESFHERYISIASIWEMAIKVNIGNLAFYILLLICIITLICVICALSFTPPKFHRRKSRLYHLHLCAMRDICQWIGLLLSHNGRIAGK